MVQWTKEISYDYQVVDITEGIIGKNLDASYGESGNEREAIPGKKLPYIQRIECRICDNFTFVDLDDTEKVTINYTLDELTELYFRSKRKPGVKDKMQRILEYLYDD